MGCRARRQSFGRSRKKITAVDEFWCELAMAIGGKTIAELQASINPKEMAVWYAYKKKYGPMNDVRRFDRPAALVASMISAANGGKAKMNEFMPWGPGQKQATFEDVAKALGKVEHGKRKKRG